MAAGEIVRKVGKLAFGELTDAELRQGRRHAQGMGGFIDEMRGKASTKLDEIEVLLEQTPDDARLLRRREFLEGEIDRFTRTTDAERMGWTKPTAGAVGAAAIGGAATSEAGEEQAPRRGPMPRPPVQIPAFTDEFPLDAMLADRERSRLDAEWEAIGGVNFDPTEQGMEQAAQGGQAMGAGGTRKITSPLESTSEQVRDRASQAAGQGPLRQGLDKVLTTLTGSSLEEIEKAVNEGTLPEKVSTKLVDPVGNISEALLVNEAKRSGLDDATAAQIGTLGGVALGMVMPGGPRKIAKVEEAALKAAEVVARVAGKGSAAAAVEAAAAAKTAAGHVRLYRGEAIPTGKKLPDWVEQGLRESGAKDAAGRWYTDDPKIAEWYLKEAQHGGGQGRVVSVDVPRDVYEQARVTGRPEAKFSKDPEREFFIPREYAAKATPIEPPGGGAAVPPGGLPPTPGGTEAPGVLAGPVAMEGGRAVRNRPGDITAVAQNIAKFNAERMTAGKVGHAETIAKAESLMTLEEAVNLDPAKYDLATIQTAVAGHYKSAEAYFRDVAQRALGGDAAAKADYWGAFAIATDLAEKDALLGTQVGRGLEARKIALAELRGSTDPNTLKQMAETMAGGVEAGMDIETHAKRMLALSPKQRDITMRQTISYWKAGQNAFLEAWINGLISGPQTHVANTLGSAIIAAWAPVERTIAATADAVITGAGTWGERSVYYGEVPQMMYGMVEGLKDGLRLLGKQMKEEVVGFKRGAEFVAEDLAEGVGKMERPKAITAEAFGLDPTNIWGGTVDFIGGIARGSGRGLMTEDAIMKATNYRGELRALAYREAAQEGLSGKPFWNRVREIVADPPPAVKEAADQFKLTNTLNAAFKDMGLLGALGESIQSGVERVPILRTAVPFVKTPTGSLHYASERVPILSIISDTVRADLFGKNGGAARAQAWAKVTGGLGVSMVIASYAAAPLDPENPRPYMNMCTGEGPKDPRMRAELTALGWQAYSCWNPITEKYVSYKRSDPMSTIFGIVATYKEVSGQLSEQGKLEMAWAMGIAAQKAMLSKTFLTGLSDFLDSMEGNPQDINRFFNGLARSGVPAIVRQSMRALDPVKRDVDTLFDHWRSGLPGYGGPAEHNIWGEEVTYEGGLGPDVASPYYTTTPKKLGEDPVSDWLVQNKIVISAAPESVGRAPAGETPYIRTEADKPVKLTKEERQRLKVLVGQGGQAPKREGDLGPLEGEPRLKDAIGEIIAGSGTDGPGGTKASMIQSRVNDRKAAAIRQLRTESPELDRELTRREKASMDLKTEGPPPRKPGLGPGLTIR